MNNDEIEIEINIIDWEEQKDTEILEYIIKVAGIWKFHKYDKDSCPSKPHGHNLDTGEKLDVYTGIRYDKNGNLNGKLGEKKLAEIQNKLKDKGFMS